MLQAGVGTRDLDVRWVSSISWYFLTLFGLQPVYNFILGSSNGKSALSIRKSTKNQNTVVPSTGPAELLPIVVMYPPQDHN